MNIRFGILPKLETQMCIDRTWFEGNVLFPENLAGDLKIVCHGRRIAQEEITRVELSSLQAFHNQKIVLTDLDFVKEAPEVNLTDEKLVDAFGQNKRKEWKRKNSFGRGIKRENELPACGTGKTVPVCGLVKIRWLDAQKTERREPVSFQGSKKTTASGGWLIRLAMHLKHWSGLCRP